MKCEHWVYPTNSWGKMSRRKCDKEAVTVDSNGRKLCKNHYNRWVRKMEKHHPEGTDQVFGLRYDKRHLIFKNFNNPNP